VAVANSHDVHRADTIVVHVADAVVVKVTIGAIVVLVTDSVVVGVVKTIASRFLVVALAVLVHVQTIVFVVANAVGICVGEAITTALTKCVVCVAVAVAVTSWDVRTSALVDFTWTVANAACIKRAHAVVDVVANAVRIRVCCTVSAANTEGVELVSFAVAVAGRLLDASAIVDRTWAVTNAALVKRAEAIFFIVANAVSVDVLSAVSAANAQGIFLVAVAIAIAFRLIVTSTLVDGARAVANSAGVKLADTIVLVVANAVAVCIRSTIATAHAKGIFRS
jgi:hypothetical protein